MYAPEIILGGAPNARDLGGIETLDGRTLRHGRLIRSGMLSRLDDKDIAYLKSAGLRTVVDFRTAAERIQKPDRLPEGTEYIVCPMLEDKTDGITHDKPETEDEEARRTVKMVRRLMERDPDGAAQMRSLYPVLVTLEHSVLHYRQFFEILLRHEEGLLLYHCTMGKDRVGTATALVLSALGVSRDEIYSDYLITRSRCAQGTERLVENCRRYTGNAAELEFIRMLDTVSEDFLEAAFDAIDENYGGMDSFLRGRMGLDDEKLSRLRELYLY